MIAATVGWLEDGAPSRYDAPRERVATPIGWLAFDRAHLFMLLSVNLNMERRKTSWVSNLQTV